MTRGRIITTHVYPPIPNRRWDWSAHHDGEEESGHYGWGQTKAEAVADLLRLDQERHEAEHPEIFGEFGEIIVH